LKNKYRGNVTTKESPNTHLKKKKKGEKANIQERRRAIEISDNNEKELLTARCIGEDL